MSDDACYRAMDWLIAVEDRLARGVFDAVAHLLNLEVDLIFFDTTSTYFETEDADEPVWRDEHGRVDPCRARRRPRPGANRCRTDAEPAATTAPLTPGSRRRARRAGRVPHPRQVQGLPRRPPAGRGRDGRDPRRDPGAGVVLAGQHLDSPLIRQVKDELRDWTLGKVIWVADRGFTSAANRRHLTAGGGLHPGREAALRLGRGHRRAWPARAATRR